MNTSQPGLSARELIIATLAALVLAACGTTRNQGQISPIETALATHLIVPAATIRAPKQPCFGTNTINPNAQGRTTLDQGFTYVGDIL